MSSLPRDEAELVSAHGAPRSLRYLPHVLLATAVVSLVPIAIVWALRDRGVIRSAWVALPLAVALSLLAAALGSAWWSRRRRGDDLMFSELLLWGWLRRVYIDHKVGRAVGQLGLVGPSDQPDRRGVTVKRRIQLLSQLAGALEAQDPYLVGHSRRVARHATMIARKIGLSGDQVARIRRAAVLHDVGKLRVPRGLLDKPGRLSATEFDQVKPHADEGAKMIAALGDDQLTSIVRHHHERLDGTGYPDGLRGADIPLGARVIAVADMYDAMTAPRPYRPAAPHKQAIDMLREESLTHLDPALVRAFRSCYSGRGPLAFWESLAAWTLALHLFPSRAPAIARRLSLREVMATTLAATVAAVAAIAAPIGWRGGERHAPAPSRNPSVALARTQPSHPGPGSGQTRHAPAPARRSAPIVKRRPAPSTGTPSATRHLAQATTTRLGARPGTGQTPASPVSTGRAPSSPHPPTTTAHQSPPRPRPRPASPRPPTTIAVSHPQTTPATPATGAPTPTPGTPTSTPPPPVAGSTGPPLRKDACKSGGYDQYGFTNQGRCVATVENGG
jgi:putative nucleotidyltransferase with HDIG domain